VLTAFNARSWKFLLGLILLLSLSNVTATTLNIFAWGSEVPDSLIQKFERQTGIKINFSTYDSNEAMLAKLDFSNDYDVIIPSSNAVARLIEMQRLAKLDKAQLPNFKNINPIFLHQSYDPKSEYAIPFLWGGTGLFTSLPTLKSRTSVSWNVLWSINYRNKLLILDDPREVFAMVLISMGYSANDSELTHLKQAYVKLKKLGPNIKLFSSNTVKNVIVDGDAKLGMAWSGDIQAVNRDGTDIKLFYPEQGFAIGIDCFSILKSAPHKKAAHKFLNFMMEPDHAKRASLFSGFPTANLAAFKLMPPEIRNSKTIYPSDDILKKGQVLSFIGNKPLKTMLEYWQKFKLSL
jgi:spermidine/putrescine transport system substrate-binding protein